MVGAKTDIAIIITCGNNSPMKLRTSIFAGFIAAIALCGTAHAQQPAPIGVVSHLNLVSDKSQA